MPSSSPRTVSRSLPVLVAAPVLVALVTLGTGGAAWAAPTATPPGPPQSVTATPANASIVVAWQPPSSTGGSAITGYTATCAAGAAATTTKVGATLRTATVTGLTNGTAYTCSVTATSAAGTGPAGAAAAVTPVGPPGAPKSVLAATKPGSIIVTWHAPSTGGSPLTGYTVACTSTDGGATLNATAPASAKTVTISGLTSGTTYGCKVKATNAKGTSPAAASADLVQHVAVAAAGATSTMHLPVTAGQRVTLVGSGDTFSSDGCVDLAVDAPDHSELSDGCLYQGETSHQSTSAPFSAAGTATAVLTPPSGATGGAELAAYVFTDITKTITAGGPALALTTTAPGQVAYVTFSGHAAEVVSSTLTASTVAGTFDLRTPAGDEIGYAGFYTDSDGFIDATTLTAAGTYSIVVSPGSWATGSTTLRLYDVPSNTGTITVGGAAATVGLPVPGETGTRTFSAAAGQHLTVAWTGNTIEGYLDVLDAAGNELSYSYLYSTSAASSITFTVPAAGTYRVVVDGTYDHTGSLSLRVHA